MDSQNTKEKNQIKNSEYKELVDFLGVKFENIDKKFENIDRKFESIDKKFDEINAKIDTLADRMARTNDKIDDYHADQIGMQRQLDKHEKWNLKIADKIGINLNN